MARFRFALPTRVSLCVNHFLVKIVFAFNVEYEKAYCPAFRVILAARSEISTRGRGVLDISLGGEVRRGPSYPDPVQDKYR